MNEPLTPRLKQIITLVAQGYTTKEIADQLGLSPKTVNSQRHLGQRLLGTRSTAATVHKAIQLGWVRVGDVKDI